MADLESILHFLDETLQPEAFPDYPHALNGLQVDGPEEIRRVGACVDASEQSLRRAKDMGVDLLLVHHGLFWDGLGPLTGPRFRKLKAAVEGGIALYSMHLPLDAHPDLGNCALLCRAMGMEPQGRFGDFRGAEIGWWSACDAGREDVLESLRLAVRGEARLIPGGPERVRKVGVLTGAGASFLGEAASRGFDALVTGEAPHHAYHEAMEVGVNLFLGGHYATEVFGVRALAQLVASEFGISWSFIDIPTGL